MPFGQFNRGVGGGGGGGGYYAMLQVMTSDKPTIPCRWKLGPAFVLFVIAEIIRPVEGSSITRRQVLSTPQCQHSGMVEPFHLTAFSRVLNHGTVHCARCLISREQLYLYTIGLLFVLQTHVI